MPKKPRVTSPQWPVKVERLLWISHYHQRPGSHPLPMWFQSGNQCIELITSGRGWIEVGKTWREVGPGDLLWHVLGDVSIGRSDFANPYNCLSVRFQDPKSNRRPVPRFTRWDDLDEVLRFTRQVVQLYVDDAFDSRVLLHYILSRVRFQAELHRRAQKEQGLPVELQRALDVVNRRYAEPLRLAELARAAEWSIPHLHDRCKEHLGLSPHQILIRRRVQAARELLAGTNEPVKSIAWQCGFPTVSGFCAQFKRATQLSPLSYRNRQHAGIAGRSVSL